MASPWTRAERARAIVYPRVRFAMAALTVALSLACKEEELPPYAQAEGTGLLVVEAEQYDRVTSSRSKSWTLEAPRGYVGAGALQASPDLGDRFDTDYVGYVPSLSFRAALDEPGKYFVWVRGYAPNEEGRSVHVGLDGEAVEDASRMVISSAGRYEWTNRRLRGEQAFIEVPDAGVHSIDVWMREDGFVFDRLLLTPEEDFTGAQGGALGPPESPRGDAPQTCGNGAADTDEVCDGQVCCTSVCTLAAADTFCGNPSTQTLCRTPEVCSGATATCGTSNDIAGCTCTAPNACTLTIEMEDEARVSRETYVVDPVNAGYVRIPEGETSGALSTRFVGPTGTYSVELVIGRESDGRPELTLAIGGAQVRVIIYPTTTAALESHTIVDIPPQPIAYGDLIELIGKAKSTTSGDAWARVDKLVIKSMP